MSFKLPSILANWSRLWAKRFQLDGVLEGAAVFCTRKLLVLSLFHPPLILFFPQVAAVAVGQLTRAVSSPKTHRKEREGHSRGNSKNGAGISENPRRECRDPVRVMSISPLMENRQWGFVFQACERISKDASWQWNTFNLFFFFLELLIRPAELKHLDFVGFTVQCIWEDRHAS